MKNRLVKIFAVICLLCVTALAAVACESTKITVGFVVDGKEYAIIRTSGGEIDAMPINPEKDGYVFDGWYWDEGVWQRPFTLESLQNEPLTSDMAVYAKFSEIDHEHALTFQPEVKATCQQEGQAAYYSCSCGKMFADANGLQELYEIPQINKAAHRLSDWIVDSKKSCATSGLRHIECTVCHEIFQTEVIPADHTYAELWTSDAKGHWHVATCQHTYEATEIIPHSYNANYKCTVCGYKDTSLHGAEIATEVFEVDGGNLYVEVPNAQETFSFNNAIRVADDATFIVATDFAASNVIRTKTVTLEIGDNTFYLLVENGNAAQLYTVTIHRKYKYTVTFETNGGTACENQQVDEGGLATQPTTSRTGYTFSNWDCNFATPITADTTITASWVANRYTVTYNANGGVLTATEITVIYDASFILAVPRREGYTFQGWYVGGTQITDANGYSVADWAYAENKTATALWTYTGYDVAITLSYNNAGTVAGNGKYFDNNQVTVTASEPNLGYEWQGWYDGDTLLSIERDYTFTMPSRNLNLTAKYEVLDEMSNFRFNSTATTCTITGTKDKSVTELIIPDYVTVIDDYAFNDCSNLESVTIGRGVKRIDGFAFGDCEKITRINTPSLETWCNIQGLGYLMRYGSGSKQFSVNGERITELVIPDTVTSIPQDAFSNIDITSLTIGNNVTRVDWKAFSGCRGLTSIVIPANLTNLAYNAFADCSGIAEITVSEGNTQYHSDGNCIVSKWNELVIGCKNSVIPTDGSVTAIGPCAFFGCTGLTSVVIPATVNRIGLYAFSGCAGLADIKVADGNTKYHSDGNCIIETETKSLVVGCSNSVVPTDGSVTAIAESAFEDCNLTNFTVPNSVAQIGGRAFMNCSNLVGITIGNAVTSIDAYAFYGCGSLQNVVLPASVTQIGSYAFSNCNALNAIGFAGTVAQWNGVAKASGWHSFSAVTKVICSDGEVVL